MRIRGRADRLTDWQHSVNVRRCLGAWRVGRYPKLGRFKSRLACRSLPKWAGHRPGPCPLIPGFPDMYLPAVRPAGRNLGGSRQGRPPSAMTMLHRGMEARFQGSCCWALGTPIGSATLGLAQLRGPQCPRCAGPRCLSHTQMSRCPQETTPRPSQSSVSSRLSPWAGPHLSPASSQQPTSYCTAPAWVPAQVLGNLG